MKKIFLISLVVPTIFASCTKSIDEPKKEEEKQTIYFRVQHSTTGETTNTITVKLKP